MDTGPDAVVGIHPLAGGGARQQLQHHFQIGKPRKHLVDTRDSDQRLGQRQAHATIAFGFDDAHSAGVGEQKIRAADTGGDAEKFLAQKGPRGGGQVFGFVTQIGEVHLPHENLADLLAIFMKARHHNMRRAVATQLDDQLGQVGFVGMDAGRLPARG